MKPEPQNPKQALRRRIVETLRLLAPDQRASASARARALLAGQGCWREAGSILFYAPMTGELDVWPLVDAALACGKAVALPRYSVEQGRYLACRIEDLAREIAPGRFGIREPVAACEGRSVMRLDLILVPGVAFDLRGHRLGRGKGFYDQLLATVRGPTCGVGFDEQVVDAVPVEAHDIRLDRLLTPTRWIEL